MGRTVTFPFPPQRIVSLVPSQTELLACLGLNDRVAGITKFCIHPEEWVRTKTRIGGTKNLRLDKITTLAPDLVLGNKEENVAGQIHVLEKSFPVWMSDIRTVNGALDMIVRIGEITGTENRARSLTKDIATGFARLDQTAENYRPGVLYLIWHDPVMAAGRETYIDDILQKSGFRNVVTEMRYPVLEPEQAREWQPDYIFLSSEPYPFREKHLALYRKLFPDASPVLVDGKMFSWYGPRMLQAIPYLENLHGELKR